MAVKSDKFNLKGVSLCAHIYYPVAQGAAARRQPACILGLYKAVGPHNGRKGGYRDMRRKGKLPTAGSNLVTSFRGVTRRVMVAHQCGYATPSVPHHSQGRLATTCRYQHVTTVDPTIVHPMTVGPRAGPTRSIGN